MPRLEDLSPDLRATLSLLVDRGKSYAQVAELLGISESAVRDRAHTALDALAGAPGETSPAHGDPAASPPRGSASGGAPAARRTGSGAGLPVSRRGGALLLGGIVIAIVVAVVLLTSGGGSNNTSTGTGTSASATTSTPGHSTKTSSSKPTVVNQLTLTSPEPSSKSLGVVEILAEGSQRAFYMAAEHLPPSQGFSYVIWLYNSPTSAEAISKAPTVGSNGRLQGGALLPSNAGDYHQILLTRETSNNPHHPGPIVLSGAFSLGK
jgi:Sigma-70, region 4